MKITIEIDSKNELEKLLAFLKTFKINTVKVIPADNANKNTSIRHGDKSIESKDLFGIWADNPRSIERRHRQKPHFFLFGVI